MHTVKLKRSTLALFIATLAACGGNDTEAPPAQPQSTQPAPVAATPPAATPPAAPPASVAGDCAGEQGLTYICGVQAAEDLLSLDSANLVLASGMSDANANVPGHMYLIDTATKEVTELVQGPNFTQAHDTTMFPDCPGPLNLQDFSVHGLSVAEIAPQTWSVYTTSHGEREAVEVYELSLAGAEPALAWKGCVVLPENTFSNSVARLNDGGFVVTKMMDPAQGFASIQSGGITGNVFEWHPGGEVMAIDGTELSGANGIAVSPDERYIYVAAFGSREIVRFDTSTMPIGKEAVSVDIVPDNVRWSDDGKLLVAGGNAPQEGCEGAACQTGWSVIEVDPETLEVTRIGGADQNAALQGVSSALQVDGNIWVGTFNGDRVGYFARE
ncbi:MAG TPA: SMP-30/gluconolactonase/LRE family protein [Pseudomonadales bacterium]